MAYGSALFLIGCVFIFIFVWISTRRAKNFPLGPIGLPFIGYYPFLGKYPYETFMKLGKKYGNIFSVTLGQTPVVVLNDWTAVQQALIRQSEAFNGRVKAPVIQDVMKYEDVVFSDGAKWRERRRLTLHHLRNQGFGKSAMESMIMEEIRDVCDDLEAKGVHCVIDSEYFLSAILNIIWGVTAGKRFNKNDKLIAEFSRILKLLFQEGTNTNPLFFSPWLQYLLFNKYKILMAENHNLEQYLYTEIEEHEVTYREGEIRDVVDAFLAEAHKAEVAKDKIVTFTRNNIMQVSKDLFLAGTDTSNNTLLFGLLYMATWPSIQQRVQEELDEFVGRERFPSYDDKALLNYTNAVILEILRYSSLLPLSINHTTTTETNLLGYVLPKGTVIMPNLWAVHRDPAYWKDPEIFNPDRYFDKHGRCVKPDYLIPFSVGGRACLGESLAKMSFFLFFSCLLHQFSVSFPVGSKQPSLKPIFKITLCPQPFLLQFYKR